MAQGFTILVVASDMAVRQSLRFVLEAEGYGVILREEVPMPDAPMLVFDCVVVDEGTIRMGAGRLAALLDRAQPVVLMVNHLPGMPVHSPIRVVEKPMLGSMLIETIRQALTPDASAST